MNYPPGQPPVPHFDPYQPAQPPKRPKRKGLRILGWSALSLAALIVVAGIAGSHMKTPAAPASPAVTAPAVAATSAAPPSPSPKPAAQTVTYIVTGSPADVMYGPAGTDLAGTVPMTVTRPLGSPSYYSISAQLQGGGDVKCAIEVDGKVIASGEGAGGYNIAACEISQNPLTGNWENTNGGG
jgi:hypothetical protein